MHKIRPNRIAKGMAKAVAHKVSGKVSAEVEQRVKTCNGCPFLTKIRSCEICGCQVDAKAEVAEEYCPKNFWDDTRVLAQYGLVIKNKSADVVSMDLFGDRVILQFKNELLQNTPVTVNLALINDRENFFDDNTTVSRIKLLATCSCTTTTSPAEKLEDGDSTDFSITYSNKNQGEFAKTSKLKTDKGIIYIELKGKTK